jgi:hypothetical protein
MFVMAGLVPTIRVFVFLCSIQDANARDRRGHGHLIKIPVALGGCR